MGVYIYIYIRTNGGFLNWGYPYFRKPRYMIYVYPQLLSSWALDRFYNHLSSISVSHQWSKSKFIWQSCWSWHQAGQSAILGWQADVQDGFKPINCHAAIGDHIFSLLQNVGRVLKNGQAEFFSQTISNHIKFLNPRSHQQEMLS